MGSVGAGSVGAGSVGVGSVGAGSVGAGSVGAGSVGAGSVGAAVGSVGSSGVPGTQPSNRLATQRATSMSINKRFIVISPFLILFFLLRYMSFCVHRKCSLPSAREDKYEIMLENLLLLWAGRITPPSHRDKS